jgi:hypothetical protein
MRLSTRHEWASSSIPLFEPNNAHRLPDSEKAARRALHQRLSSEEDQDQSV